METEKIGPAHFARRVHTFLDVHAAVCSTWHFARESATCLRLFLLSEL